MIEIKDLSVIYDQNIIALDHFDLTIKENQCSVIIGQNGSGKSTLFQTILGLIDFQGQIIIDDIPVDSNHLIQIRNKVGLVFQNPEHQLFMNTVYDDLAFGLINQGIHNKDIQQRIDKIAKDFKINSLLRRSSHKMSGGQKRLAAIATVLIMEPDIILMDEPTSSLDPGCRRQVIELLKTLHKTLVITTHDLDMAYDLADEVILLNHGKVIAQESAKTLLTNKNLLEENGLELPFRFQR